MEPIKLLPVLFASLLFSLSNLSLAQDIQTIQIKSSSIPEIFHLDGVVEAVHQSTVSAQTSGQVRELHFDIDDYVKKGQVILVLDNTEHKARLKQAKANLKAANAGLQDAIKEHERIRGVFEKKLVAKSNMDKAKASLKKARANHESAIGALDQAQKQLEYTRVKAPYSGIVTQRHIEPGEIAQPGKLLMSGISLDKLRVVVDVPQSIINMVRREGKTLVEKTTGEWIAVEKLTIFPFADEKSNTFKVRLYLPVGIEGLLPGMYVKTSFITGTNQMLLVPRHAVVYRSEVTGIYVINEQGKVIFRHIRLGHAVNSHQLIVLSGLSENEHVAVDPIIAGALLKQQMGK